MQVNVIRKTAGTVLTTTWVSSGMIPVPITSALYDKNRALVSSCAGVSSGFGNYYGVHQLPATPAVYMQEWRAWINSHEYVRRQLVSTSLEDID